MARSRCSYRETRQPWAPGADESKAHARRTSPVLEAAGARGGNQPGPEGVRETSQGGTGEQAQCEVRASRAWRKRRRALRAGGCLLPRLGVEALQASRDDLPQALTGPRTPLPRLLCRELG